MRGFTLVGSSLACKYKTKWKCTAVTNTTSYYDKATVFAAKSFIVQASGKNITISLAKTHYNYRHVNLKGEWFNMSGS